jgi:uncharacterized protein YndB with AHSA1/START domain
MDKSLIATQTVVINAPISKVWEGLTNPQLIKQYLFGTEVSSDWQVGSTITYRGVWEGKDYEDKGTILEVKPQERLVSTYWSSIGGKEDKPENYKTVSYDLESTSGGETVVSVSQDNNATMEEKAHSEQNWKLVLEGLKNLLETKT